MKLNKLYSNKGTLCTYKKLVLLLGGSDDIEMDKMHFLKHSTRHIFELKRSGQNSNLSLKKHHKFLEMRDILRYFF